METEAAGAWPTSTFTYISWEKLMAGSRDTIKTFKTFLLLTDGDDSIRRGWATSRPCTSAACGISRTS